MSRQRRPDKRYILIFAAILVAVMIGEYFVIAALQPDVEEVVAEEVKKAVEEMQGQETVTVLPTPTPSDESTPLPTIIPTTSPMPEPTPEPDPTPTSLAISLDKVYSEEDEGEEVEFIQQMLIDLGFNPGRADGIFGDRLTGAIREFQMWCEIDKDGIAGPDTLTLMVEKWRETQEVKKADKQPLKGIKIGLDPGHQEQSNKDQEKVSPNGSETKKKVSSGTYGRFTGVYEYVINLEVGLRLKRELEALGAEVIMTRETHDVDISNAKRAVMMNEAGVDCWLRIHANGSNDKSVKGMFILIPKQGTMDTDDDSIAEKSAELGEILIDATMEATDADSPKSNGLSVRGDQTGFSWSKVPVCNIEMGHMTNERDDRLLITQAYQIKIVQGLVEGFVEYFSQEN